MSEWYSFQSVKTLIVDNDGNKLEITKHNTKEMNLSSFTSN